MSRPVSDALKLVLTQSFDITYMADLFYDGVRRFEALPIVSPSIKGDSSGEIEESGSLTVMWTDDHGSSLKPQEPADWLAPYGARLVVYAVVSVGQAFTERVQLGDYLITAVPSANDEVFTLGETKITVGSTAELEFKDRMVEVQRDRFTRLSAPSQTASVWTEVATLTGLQVTRSVPDKPINSAVPYEESRVSAITDLLAILDATPYMEWDGTLAARPKTPPAAVGTLTIGPSGTITQIGSSLDAEEVYNGVVIRGETDGQQSVLAELWVTTGPLAATVPGGGRTPFHRKPRFYSNPQITTSDQAIAALPGLLQTYSQPKATTLQIQCVIDPTVQVGDVRTVFDGMSTWTVRVTQYDLGEAPTMSITGSVLNRVVN